MIIFAADDHYGMHPGKIIYEGIRKNYPDILFSENDLSVFNVHDTFVNCELLILNMIGGTCGNELPGPCAEDNIKEYCLKGGGIILLHGSSAAFWHWDWWRKIVGYRWVRKNDPDSVAASTHPVRKYKVFPSKSRHPLCAKMEALDLQEDEIYINLEQVCPAFNIMETKTDEGTFVQCYETITPWGGNIIGLIPGHRKEVTSSIRYHSNVKTLIEALLSKRRRHCLHG